jgi:hypothetical protein
MDRHEGVRLGLEALYRDCGLGLGCTTSEAIGRFGRCFGAVL